MSSPSDDLQYEYCYTHEEVMADHDCDELQWRLSVITPDPTDPDGSKVGT